MAAVGGMAATVELILLRTRFPDQGVEECGKILSGMTFLPQQVCIHSERLFIYYC